MTAGSSSRKGVPPGVLIAAAVLLLVFVVWRGWAALGPPREPPLPPPPAQDTSFLNAKAKECQGDFSKLAAADQAKVQQITHGFGIATMASTWRDEQKAGH